MFIYKSEEEEEEEDEILAELQRKQSELATLVSRPVSLEYGSRMKVYFILSTDGVQSQAT